MAEVFLSYATPDQALAQEVFSWLRDAGHDVFFDRDQNRGIELGEDWKQRLYRELRRVDAVVSLVTPQYVASTWCTAEVAIADSRGCRILPLRSTDAAHPLLDRQQYADLTTDAAREWLLVALRRIDTDGFREWRDGENPYPGLEPFTPELSGLFFGRGRESRALAAKVRVDDGRGVLAVTGPSGCGKSSLVRAGLIPALTDWLCLEPWTPGDDPVSALAHSIVDTARRNGLRWKLETVRRRLKRDDGLKELAEELLADSDGPRRTRLLVPIDQGEELFTRTDADRRARLAGLLHSALGGGVRAVITLRSEFLDDLSEQTELAADVEPFLLGPLPRDMLRLAIEEPAAVAGLRPAPELVARLVADTESGEALPLLAFTLQRLAHGRSRGDTLSLSDYDDLAARSGYRDLTGLHAVLASRADHALATAVERSTLTSADVLSGLLRLVTLDDADRRSRRRVEVGQLTDELAAAFSVFVDERLLTKDGDEIGLAHEALLTAWPSLDELIEEKGSALRAARTVERAAADWVAAKRAGSHLWDDERLAGLPRTPLNLDQRGQEFLDTSRAQADATRRRTRKRRAAVTTAMAVLSVAALIAAVIAVWQAGTLKDERDAATVRSLVAQADEARDSDPRLALQLALAADQIGSGSEALASLTSTVTMNNYAGTAGGHTSAVRAVAFGKDGRVMASGDTADHAVRLWDVSDPAKPKQLGVPLTDHTGWVAAMAFSPDGATLATASFAEVILWDVTDPAKPVKRHVLEAQPGAGSTVRTPETLGVAFAQEGRLLAATNGSALTFWVIDPAGPRRLSTPLRHNGAFSDVVISPNGQVAASATSQSEIAVPNAAADVVLWDIRDPANPVERGRVQPGKAVTALAFGKDGATLAVAANAPGAVQLLDVRDPGLPSPLTAALGEHANVINDVAFSPDGLTMITASDDGTAIMWDVSSPATPRRIGRPLTDHRGAVNEIAFSPDGTTFATAGADRTVVLWHTRDVLRPVRFGEPFRTHYVGVRTAVIQPGNRLLLTAVNGGRAQLVDISDPARPVAARTLGDTPNAVIAGQPAMTVAAAFSPDGKVLATSDNPPEHDTVVLWNVADPDHVTQYPNKLTGHTGPIVALEFSADGRTLRSAGKKPDLMRWDVSNPNEPREIGRGPTDREDVRIAVAFSPDGRTIVTGGEPGGALVLRDISDLNDVRDLGKLGDDGVAGFAFAPNGQVLATAGDEVALWDLRDLAAPRRFDGVVDAGDSTLAVAFSPDSRILAVSGRGGTVSLWNVEDPDRPRPIGSPLAGSGSPFLTLAFSPDGRMLVSGDNAGAVTLWDFSRLHDAREHLVELACARAGREFGVEEWNNYVGAGQPYRTGC
ncbi:TIR domain-containing protein [Lentzea sp. BCCO 10_0856]|uniref:TIR domain-containing protein n=1 Tax=Lentzea miocenica TaxID=3095431 RepID=A0ABU4SX46_9PSEU|nr:TIR domain-containing protein [Lentzea sp. BCCO 10_0856]MDX8030415.1 TIR domain-containing protein [Lentzea sp. BCCO 10_0856]